MILIGPVVNTPLRFPANTVLRGTYGSPVFVAGDASLGAAVVIDGDLTVDGWLNNPSGFALDVKGKLTIRYAPIFSTTSSSAAQGDLTVGGDLVFGQVAVAQTLLSQMVSTDNATIFTISRDDLPIYGIPNDSTATVTVTSGLDVGQSGHFTYAGNVITPTDGNIDFNNLLGTETVSFSWTAIPVARFFVNAGKSPKLKLAGDLTGSYVRGQGRTAGAHGLTVVVGGDCFCSVDVDGGQDGVNPGGNGGSVTIGGAASGTFTLDGGYNNGAGGTISVGSSVFGLVSAIANTGSSAGGSITVGGDVHGACIVTGGNTAGGAGGSVTIGGSSFGTISALGGDNSSNQPSAGVGGTVTLTGNAFANISAGGGSTTAGTGTGGNGGAISIVLRQGTVALSVAGGTGSSPGSAGTITESSSGSGANVHLSNLSSPTSFNQDLIFDSSVNRTIKPADINTSSGTMANFNTRVVGVSNTNAGGSAPSGTLSLLAGGSPGGPVANVLIGSAYNGSGGAGTGDYYFAELGVFGNTLPTTFALRVYQPDSATMPGTGGNVGQSPPDYWQLAPGIGGSVYKFGTNNMDDMLVDGDHGYGVPTFRHLTVFDGPTISAAFNGAIAPQNQNAVLTGSAGTATCAMPFQGSNYSGHTGYKKVIIYLNAYTDTGTQTYTFPVAFANTPHVYGLAGGVSGATITTTTIKFTTTLLSGFVFVEGN